MKRLIALACFGCMFAVSAPAVAGAQQDKMKGCSAEAKGMKGEERKAFMSKCLKKDYVLKSAAAPAAAPAAKTEDGPGTSKPVGAEKKMAKPNNQPAAQAAAPAKSASAQQDKMKNCSADAKAKGLKGTERKTFMSSCLKG